MSSNKIIDYLTKTMEANNTKHPLVSRIIKDGDICRTSDGFRLHVVPYQNDLQQYVAEGEEFKLPSAFYENIDLLDGESTTTLVLNVGFLKDAIDGLDKTESVFMAVDGTSTIMAVFTGNYAKVRRFSLIMLVSGDAKKALRKNILFQKLMASRPE